METATKTTTKWTLDPGHSEVGFKVKHMMITNVSGSFQKFDAKVETTGTDFTTAKIYFTADIDSITTKNPAGILISSQQIFLTQQITLN